MSIRWASFPKEKGWDGLNNAAINTFNSDVINSFVREIFQNSNDARQDAKDGSKQKLVIEICYKTITFKQFPHYEELLNIITQISKEPANKSHKQFFKQALSDFKKSSIRIFEYKDFNTIGLSGDDDSTDSTFNACVLSEGQSIKQDETAGGSYGIGKNSIYGLSKIRTVLYSSYDGKETIFQGVAKLASYRMNGITHDYRIYLGKGKKLSSIRRFEDLDSYSRDLVRRNERGLTQIAVCPIEHENWVDEFTTAILRNYWPLIGNSELEVTLKEGPDVKQKISSDNLDELMNRCFDPSLYDPSESPIKGNPLDYYMCFKKSTPRTENIHMLGKVKFYYTELDHKNTNHVIFIRNGMVIHSEAIWGFGSIGYCGIIMCDDRNGNSYLRMMEPPTHDKFDPSRLDSKTGDYTEADGKKALDEIKKMIKSCLNEIANQYRKKAEDIPWLNNLIKSLRGLKDNGLGSRTNEISEEESIHRITSQQKQTVIFTSIQKNIAIAENGHDPGSGQINGHGKKSGKNGQPVAGVRNPKNKNALSIKFRTYRRSKNSDGTAEYKIILNSDQSTPKKNLKIHQIGDSGTAACFQIINVVDKRGIRIPFEEVYNKQGERVAYKLKEITLPAELSILLKEPYKSTFKIEES